MDMRREIKFRGKRLDNREWVFFTPDQDCACLGVVLYNQYTAAYELRLIKAEYPIDVKGYDEEYSLNLYSFDLDGYIDLCGNVHDNPELLKTE